MEFMKKIEELSKIVGKTATDTYNTVADKSGKIIEDTKTKMAISDKEEEIAEIYANMGKTVYDMYKTGEDVGKVFSKEAKKIDSLKSEITEMNKKILFNKGLRNCSSCGEIIDVESTFCSICGEKQKTVKIKDDKKTKEQEDETKEDKVCPQCGLVSSYKNKFCTKCGYKFEK
jgi:RNA polymerase subunit RPABC4/transcription elongation factor Spt4